MGQISQGIMGSFKGTVDTVIGNSWRGIEYIRVKPIRKKSYKLSPKQLAHQQRFALAVDFVKTLSSLWALSFNNYAIRMTGKHSAISYILKNAILGTAPDFTLDYSRILISRATS